MAFFYMGPPIPLPMFDGLFVPLSCPSLRLLAAPALTPEKPPEMVRMVIDFELPPNDFGHPTGGPKIGGITVRERPFDQKAGQGLLLFPIHP